MDLAEHGDSAIGETLDEVHLPQRLAAVQRGARDPADRLVEFASAAGAVDAVWPNVVVQVDFAVLPPHRVMELQRDVDQLVAERLQLVQPAVNDLAELVDSERAASEVVEFDHRELQCVHVHGGRLGVEKHRVPAAEPFQPRTFCPEASI